MAVRSASNSGGSSGVSSFNTRTGAVTPQAGDYTAAQVGAPYRIAAFDTDALSTAGVETTLYTCTVAANQLSAEFQTLDAIFSGNYTATLFTVSEQVNAYFAGTQILTPSNIGTPGSLVSWWLSITVMRTGTSTARVAVFYADAANNGTVNETDLTGLDFTTTNTLYITGLSTGTGAANGDVTAKLGRVMFIP